jgi:hypothetical protein
MFILKIMKLNIIVLFLLFWSNYLIAQSLTPIVIASAGSFSESVNLQLSSTIGELAVNTLTSAGLVLTQGFQQPLFIGTGVSNEKELDWEVKTYPNPVYDHLNIAIRLTKPMDLNLEVYDLTGKKLWIEELRNISVNYDHTLNLIHLKNGIYLLKVTSTDQRLNRIIKILKQ